jgi:hypothetical protein
MAKQMAATPQLQKIQDRWHKEVWNRSVEVDPGLHFIWEGVLLGFLLGAGVELEEAAGIAIQAPRNGWAV